MLCYLYLRYQVLMRELNISSWGHRVGSFIFLAAFSDPWGGGQPGQYRIARGMLGGKPLGRLCFEFRQAKEACVEEQESHSHPRDRM